MRFTARFVNAFEGMKVHRLVIAAKVSSFASVRSQACMRVLETGVFAGLIVGEPAKTSPLGDIGAQRSGRVRIFPRGDVFAGFSAAYFEPASCRRIPDDFIGTEFDFMAKLADAALRAWQKGDTATMLDRLEKSQAFLRGHLLMWTAKYAARLAEAYGDCFYAHFASLAAHVAVRDANVVGELFESVGRGSIVELLA